MKDWLYQVFWQPFQGPHGEKGIARTYTGQLSDAPHGLVEIWTQRGHALQDKLRFLRKRSLIPWERETLVLLKHAHPFQFEHNWIARQKRLIEEAA